MRALALCTSGAFILQLPGCAAFPVVDFLQTVFLAITAAGSLVIIDNL